MNAQLDAALAQLNLKPGETYRTRINGHVVEVRALKAAEAAEEPSPFEDQQMLDPWFVIPPTDAAQLVRTIRSERLLPSPVQLDESDLAPE